MRKQSQIPGLNPPFPSRSAMLSPVLPHFHTKGLPVNFQKLMLIVIPAALLIGAYVYFTRVDRSDPIAVANAFTKALKDGNTAKASTYYLPAKAESWRTNA